MNKQERNQLAWRIVLDELIVLAAMAACVLCAAGAALLAFGG